VEALQEFVNNFTYLGILAVLLLGSLGVPIPEEMPIIAAAVLSHEGIVRWWLALPLCLLGVLSGDMVLYWVGRHWGEQVLNWRLARLVLSPAREQWLKAAYRRHALKTVVTARHVMGLRAAAFLTAGIARVPFWKFVVADACAALVGVPLAFGLAYFFTDQIKAIAADVHRAERWLGLVGLLRLRRCWSSGCGDRIVASGRRVWIKNDPGTFATSVRRSDPECGCGTSHLGPFCCPGRVPLGQRSKGRSSVD
jgi:membrane protein DedA with SNARE-associated domain